MLYCLESRSRRELPGEFDIDYVNPRDVLDALKELEKRGYLDVVVVGDGNEISKEVLTDVTAHQIAQICEEESILRSVFRRAYRGEPDLAMAPDGVKAVWKPENPDDRFE